MINYDFMVNPIVSLLIISIALLQLPFIFYNWIKKLNSG